MKDLTKMTNEEIENAFVEMGCSSCMVDDEYGCNVVFTHDTINDFLRAVKNYNEYGEITHNDNSLIIASVQPRRGDQRYDVYVIDFGDIRGVCND